MGSSAEHRTSSSVRSATPADEFEQDLLLPHHFIFNRDWYERFDGTASLPINGH